MCVLLVFEVLLCTRCISVVVVKGACFKDCRDLGLCKVGIVGGQWVMSV
jgi:hypothetical protein